jgi:hypothetical protein
VDSTNEPTDADIRVAQRQFLARLETRLSTLHRVIGAFVGGAGLLVLVPIFFKDSFIDTFSILISARDQAQGLATEALLVVSILTVAVPLSALYFLIRDLVRVYFTSHTFGAPDAGTEISARFGVSALYYPSDEPGFDRDSIDRLMASDDIFPSLIPRNGVDRSHLIREYGRDRMLHRAAERPETPAVADLIEMRLRHAGAIPRTLANEVAKAQVAVARHALQLRTMVLRYFKALLVFLTTTIISLGVVAVLRDIEENAGSADSTVTNHLIVVALFYGVWSALILFVVRRPIVWINGPAGRQAQVPRQSGWIMHIQYVMGLPYAPELASFEVGVLCVATVVFILATFALFTLGSPLLWIVVGLGVLSLTGFAFGLVRRFIRLGDLDDLVEIASTSIEDS